MRATPPLRWVGIGLLLVLVCGTMGASLQGTAPAEASAAQLLSRAVEAAGGSDALEATRSMQLEAVLYLGMLNQEGTLHLVHDGRDRWRLRQFLPLEGFPGGGIEEVIEVDGDTGEIRSDLRGNRPLSPQEIRSARLTNDPAWLAGFLVQFPDARPLGPSSRRGESVRGLEAEDPMTGEPLRLYFSEETGHLVAMELTLISEEMQLRAWLDFSDFRPVDHLVLPFNTRIDLGLGITEIRVVSVVLGDGVAGGQ